MYRESAGNEIWEALDSESDIADAIASDAIRFLTPIDQLAVYRWGTGTGADYFCPTCGVMPFRKPSVPTPEEAEAGVARFEGWAVNARCIDDLDLDAMPRVRIRGNELKI